MRAAYSAASDALATMAAEDRDAPGSTCPMADADCKENRLERAAERAARPILLALTPDDDMVAVIASGMAAEALRLLRHRGML